MFDIMNHVYGWLLIVYFCAMLNIFGDGPEAKWLVVVGSAPIFLLAAVEVPLWLGYLILTNIGALGCC